LPIRSRLNDSLSSERDSHGLVGMHRDQAMS